eukprot:COSAG03_NODE_156_length_11431_cov_14.727674_4_plen_491_part_00
MVVQFKQSVRAACRETFDGEDALFASAAAEGELRQLFRAIDSDSDGFIGTKEYKTFLVGCTSVFLTEMGAESARPAGPGGKNVALDSEDLSQEAHGLQGQQELPSTMLLRRRRRGHDTGYTVGWMAPTAASQAMGTQSSMAKGRNSLGAPKPLRRRSHGGEHGRVVLAPLVDATASFLRPTRVSKLGQREKHIFDERDVIYRSLSTHRRQPSVQATVPRRAASAMELQAPAQRDQSRRLSEESQQLQQRNGAQPVAKPRNRIARAELSVTQQNDVEDIVDENLGQGFSAATETPDGHSNGTVGICLDEQKQGDEDQVLLKLKSKEERRKKTAAVAAASFSETIGGGDEMKEVLNSSEESLQPWEKKQKKQRGPPLAGAKVVITPIEVDLSSAAAVGPNEDKVMMMMKAKEEKKKQRQELAKSKTDDTADTIETVVDSATQEPEHALTAGAADANKDIDGDLALMLSEPQKPGGDDKEGTATEVPRYPPAK